MKEKSMKKEYRDLNRNQKIAFKEFTNPDNTCLNDIAEKTGIQFHTILGYAQDQEFIDLVIEAKKAFKETD